MLLLVATALAADPIVGADFTPIGRFDLLWAQSEQPTGTFVGELDGLIAPPLSAWAGLRGDRTAWILGLSMARTSTTTWTAEDRRKQVVTGIRPALDVRRDLTPREVGEPVAWVGLGAWGVIPIVRDTSTAYGDEETADAREGSREIMARVGGFGGRAGLGADYLFTDALSLGLQSHLQGWRGQRYTEDALLISTLVSVQAAVRVELQF